MTTTKATTKHNAANNGNGMEFEAFLQYVKNINTPEDYQKMSVDELKSIYNRIKSKNYSTFDFFYVYNKNNNAIQIIPAYSFFYKKIIDQVEYINFEYSNEYFDIIIKRKNWASETKWRVFYSEHEWKKKMNSYWSTKFHFMARRAGIIDMIKIVFSDLLENEIGIYYHDDSIYSLLDVEEITQNLNETMQNNNLKEKLQNNSIPFKPENIDKDKNFLEFYEGHTGLSVVKAIIENGERVMKHFKEIYDINKNILKDKMEYFYDLEYIYKNNIDRTNHKTEIEALRLLSKYITKYYEQKRQANQ